MRSFIYVLLCLIYSGPSILSQTTTTVDLHHASIHDLQQWMEEGLVTSVQLVEFYLDRIDRLDQAGPEINSVLALNPDAKSIAMQRDLEREHGRIRGPMHGIPVLIKDNIETGDKMPTTAGSLLLRNHFAREDAFIVKRLREAGAVILGKTNLSEWANFRSTESSSGWSSLGGQTKNPYDTTVTPCGSSSGSGAAVASDFCTISIGTETDGSIACPSSVNGIVGLKPTVGLWSRSGVIPISHTQDTPGPMARSVMDAAILLGVCSEMDPKDTATLNQEAVNDYTIYCQKDALKGSRLGVDTSFLNRDDSVSLVFRESLLKMKDAGAEIIPLSYTPLMQGIGSAEFSILLYEFKHDMAQYLSESGLPYENLKDLIQANEANAGEIMPIFGQEIFLMAEDKGPLTDSAYQAALVQCTHRTRVIIDSVMQQFQLNAIVGPAMGVAWKIDHVNGDKGSGPSAYSIASRAGYPSITIPSGKVRGLPVAISLIAGAYEEGELIRLAYDFERQFDPEWKVDF